jgi:hypothetical protein
MIMESKLRKIPASPKWVITIFIAGILSMTVNSLSAETYRWKDKDGKVHYGATVPAEYADQPYDILNNSGLVIEHVEDTSIPMEVIEAIEEKKKGREPLISEEDRQIQTDKLLVIQYGSEEDITKALELEIAQLGYDSRIIEQSSASTNKAIRDQIRLAADKQRSNQPVNEEQKKEIAGLYSRRARDEKKRAAVERREERIRARFQKDLDRYRFLTTENQQPESDQVDQG